MMHMKEDRWKAMGDVVVYSTTELAEILENIPDNVIVMVSFEGEGADGKGK